MNKIFLPIILLAALNNPITVGQGVTLVHQYDNEYGQYVSQFGGGAYINWLMKPSPGVFQTPHIPMVWCLSQAEQAIANPELLSNAEIVLLFNEPGTTGQCDITPEQAAEVTLQLQATFPNIQYWGSPSTVCNEYNLPDGCDPDWLDEYLELCQGCKIDFIQAHHYDGFGSSCSYSKMVAHLETFKSYGLPIWVTEFGCITPNEQQRLQAYEDWSTYFEADPQILAWFPWTVHVDWPGWSQGNFVNDNGELTSLGKLYRDLGEQH